MTTVPEPQPKDDCWFAGPHHMYDLDGNPIGHDAVNALISDIDARRVDYTELPDPDGGPPAIISTIFTVTDYSFGIGDRQLWETRVMQGPMAGMQTRWTSREQAVQGHAAIAAIVRAVLAGDEHARKLAEAFNDDDDEEG